MLPQTTEWVNSPVTEHRFFKNRVEGWKLFLCWSRRKKSKKQKSFKQKFSL